MSDIEEPPTKLSKLEVSRQMDGDSMEDGQEEWLSEEILTDDDNHPSQDNNASTANTSQNSRDSIEHLTTSNLDHLDRSSQEASKSQLEDQLDEFLIRKNSKNESDLDESTKQSNDDGNDTDDLLRMLGDEEKDKNGMNENTNSDDDDDFVFSAKLKQNLGKSMMKASKAVPEDSSDDEITGASSDENLMNKMFRSKTRNVASKSTSKSSISSHSTTKVVQKSRTEPKGATQLEDGAHMTIQRNTYTKILKSLVNFRKSRKDRISVEYIQTRLEELKTFWSDFRRRHEKCIAQAKRDDNKSLELSENDLYEQCEQTYVKYKEALTTGILSLTSTSTESRDIANQSTLKGFMNKKYHNKSLLKPLKTEPKVLDKPQMKPKIEPPSKQNGSRTAESEQNSDFEETLDEDFEYDEGLMDVSERHSGKLTMMKPERMDEDFLTDEESLSGDDDSIYDELPTTDSEMEDWFDLDIRAERAGDYLPLLGDKAHRLLQIEKERVTERVTELRRTLSTLAKTGREQAEALQKATLTLAELDTMLKTA